MTIGDDDGDGEAGGDDDEDDDDEGMGRGSGGTGASASSPSSLSAFATVPVYWGAGGAGGAGSEAGRRAGEVEGAGQQGCGSERRFHHAPLPLSFVAHGSAVIPSSHRRQALRDSIAKVLLLSLCAPPVEHSPVSSAEAGAGAEGSDGVVCSVDMAGCNPFAGGLGSLFKPSGSALASSSASASTAAGGLNSAAAAAVSSDHADPGRALLGGGACPVHLVRDTMPACYTPSLSDACLSASGAADASAPSVTAPLSSSSSPLPSFLGSLLPRSSASAIAASSVSSSSTGRVNPCIGPSLALSPSSLLQSAVPPLMQTAQVVSAQWSQASVLTTGEGSTDEPDDASDSLVTASTARSLRQGKSGSGGKRKGGKAGKEGAAMTVDPPTVAAFRVACAYVCQYAEAVLASGGHLPVADAHVRDDHHSHHHHHHLHNHHSHDATCTTGTCSVSHTHSSHAHKPGQHSHHAGTSRSPALPPFSAYVLVCQSLATCAVRAPTPSDRALSIHACLTLVRLAAPAARLRLVRTLVADCPYAQVSGLLIDDTRAAIIAAVRATGTGTGKRDGSTTISGSASSGSGRTATAGTATGAGNSAAAAAPTHPLLSSAVLDLLEACIHARLTKGISSPFLPPSSASMSPDARAALAATTSGTGTGAGSGTGAKDGDGERDGTGSGAGASGRHLEAYADVDVAIASLLRYLLLVNGRAPSSTSNGTGRSTGTGTAAITTTPGTATSGSSVGASFATSSSPSSTGPRFPGLVIQPEKRRLYRDTYVTPLISAVAAAQTRAREEAGIMSLHAHPQPFATGTGTGTGPVTGDGDAGNSASSGTGGSGASSSSTGSGNKVAPASAPLGARDEGAMLSKLFLLDAALVPVLELLT